VKKKATFRVLFYGILVLITLSFIACIDSDDGDRGGSKKTDQVTVTFNTDGGSNIDSIKIKKGTSMGDDYPAFPVKDEYHFDGWYHGDKEYTKDTVINSNITLKAKWAEGEPEKVDVTFNADGGSPAPSPIQVAQGSSMAALYPANPAKTGYNFDGWYNGEKHYTSATAIEDDITLTAKWTAISYTVKYNANEGTGSMPDSPRIYDDGKTLSANTFNRTGHTFSGWNTAANGSGTAYAAAASVNLSTTQGAVVNLYAQWSINSYTVTFSLNNGSGTTPAAQTKNYNTQITLPTGTFTRSGYLFDGWNTRADGSGTNYNAGASYTVTETLTLYARWASGTAVTEWYGFTFPTGTTATEYTSLKGKTDVLRINPTGSEYSWAAMSQSLSGYTGKDITIAISFDVWVDTAAKIAYQINISPDYPIIAGNINTPISTGQWVTVHGSNIITVPSGGCTLYLSGGGSGGQLQNNAIPIYFANFYIEIYEGSGGTEGETNVPITIGDKRDLATLLPAGFGTPSWSGGTTNITRTGSVVTAVSFSSGGGNTFVSGPATATAVITATTTGGNTHTFNITATTAAQTDIMNLPPMKDADQIGKHFALVGNIFNPGDVNSGGTDFTGNGLALKRHYNILTMENNMKPSYLSNNNGTGFTWNTGNRDTAERMINAARAQNIKVVGHALLWHSQNPDWVWNQIASKTGTAIATPEAALATMKNYITTVAGHSAFKGKLYSWDVLNEVFPDNASRSNADSWKTQMRSGKSGEGQDANPWFVAIGHEFVYEAFLAARLADPDAILYYNDYNTDNATRADLIRDMVQAVNNQYAALPANQKPAGEASGRKLIEGIGMQEHHNLSVSASSVRTTLGKFRAIGVKVAVSELDVLGTANYGDFSPTPGSGTNKHTLSPVTNTQLITQATRFAEYMTAYIEYKDIVERVSLWGVRDSNSWRSGGLPLLFDHNGKAKPAYYKFLEAAQQEAP
jgi:uncharacterized repeat protein (TIGR02543 family)